MIGVDCMSLQKYECAHNSLTLVISVFPYFSRPLTKPSKIFPTTYVCTYAKWRNTHTKKKTHLWTQQFPS